MRKVQRKIITVIEAYVKETRLLFSSNFLGFGNIDFQTFFAQGSKYRMHTCTNARKIRDVHVTFVIYMHCVHVEIFT